MTSTKSGNSLSTVPWQIYVSRALSNWGDRLWTFGVGVFLTKLDPSNLQACVVLVLNFWLFVDLEWFPPWVSSGLVIFLSAVANLASVGCKITIEKDWIVVVSEDNEERLATMNAVFRTIDLTCLIVAPMIAGFIFDFASTEAAAIAIASWNIVSVVIEFYLLVVIYRRFPLLSAPKTFAPNIADMTTEEGNAVSRGWQYVWSRTKLMLHSWKLYLTSEVREAGIALSLLYMTVLGFDNITYAYCLDQCVSESLLGGMVALSAIFGIAGSFAFPWLRKTFDGCRITGLIGFSALNLALAPSIVSIWLPGSPFDPFYLAKAVSTGSEAVALSPSTNGTSATDVSLDDKCQYQPLTSVIVFLASIITARTGLWISDLSVTQIMQERVPEKFRGEVNGVQNGVNSLMDTFKFALVIGLPNMETFGYLVIASVAAATTGGLFFTAYYIETRC